MHIILAQPRGFCAGVKRAIEIVEKALEIYGKPIYVRHEIVHNKYVVDDLKSKGVIFVKNISEIPDNGVTIFSAHGVSQKIINKAKIRNLPIIDATCPLVKKVHNEAQRSKGEQIILIGHSGHPEVEGTSGQVTKEVVLVEKASDINNLKINNPDQISYVTQTTLSVDDTKDIIDALKKKFPNIKGPGIKDICYATQNRQDAVRKLAKIARVLLVIGSQNSSNSNRLRDLGEEMGMTSYLINGAEDINPEWFNGKDTIGITAGASAPELLVEQIIKYLGTLSSVTVSAMDGKMEDITFKLPKEIL